VTKLGLMFLISSIGGKKVVFRNAAVENFQRTSTRMGEWHSSSVQMDMYCVRIYGLVVESTFKKDSTSVERLNGVKVCLWLCLDKHHAKVHRAGVLPCSIFPRPAAGESQADLGEATLEDFGDLQVCSAPAISKIPAMAIFQ
jgi:hypothetical protein